MGRAAAIIAGLGGADTTAPVLSSAQSTAQTSSTADISVVTDTSNGTMWWVVIPAANTAPNAAQVRAGTGRQQRCSHGNKRDGWINRNDFSVHGNGV